jgi:shikimate kinase
MILVGLPGSGKTTLARGIARAFSLSWVDLDHEIERVTGEKIAALFARVGEAGFREAECRVLQSVLDSAEGSVVSTGGGIVTHEASRALLRARQPVVYLHALPEQIAPRIRNDGVRPMFVGQDPRTVLARLYAERDPLYREASSALIDVGDGNVRAAQERLAALLPRAHL